VDLPPLSKKGTDVDEIEAARPKMKYPEQVKSVTFFQKFEYIIPQLWFFRSWNV
jgi:hypothetical protein